MTWYFTRRPPKSLLKLINNIYQFVHNEIHLGVVKERFSIATKNFERGDFVLYQSNEKNPKLINFLQEDWREEKGLIKEIQTTQIPKEYIKKLI